MAPKFAHTTTTANMKRNALFCKTVISLRGIARARIFYMILLETTAAKTWSNPERLLSPFPKPTNKWGKTSKIEMHNVLALYKCSIYARIELRCEMRWVRVSISADSCQICIDMLKTNVIWIRDLPNEALYSRIHTIQSRFISQSAWDFILIPFFSLKKPTINGRVFYRYSQDFVLTSCCFCRLQRLVYKTNQTKTQYNSYNAVAPFVVGNLIVNQIIKGEKNAHQITT